MTAFKPMLAGKAPADLSKLRYPVFVSPKLDGVRCVVLNGKALTRSLKPIPNKHIRGTIEALGSLLDGLDGEITLADATRPFHEVSSAVMAREGEPDFRFWVFDDFTLPCMSFEDRHSAARRACVHAPEWVGLVPHSTAFAMEDIERYEARYLAQGYEGAMIRDPEASYKCGRSTAREGSLLKLKRFEDGEAVVIGFEEQQQNTNEATRDELGRTKRSSAKAGKRGKNTLGKLLVRGINGKFKDVDFAIGTGFTDTQRRSLWGTHLNGQLVKYRYQAYGSKDAPRLPVFVGFRDKSDL